jgi:flagellar basal-body rod modification protein FlgD
MADETTKVGSSSGATNSLQSFVGSKKNDQISKDQFLQLLVTQLKNQDPLDPMKSEEFAVNLAQFSQLEQLVSINEKVGVQSTDLSSLAAYLGNEVALNTDKIKVEGGRGGLLRVDLPKDVTALEVELIDSNGRLEEVVNFSAIEKGKKTLDLGTVSASNGEYTFRVKGTSSSGTFEVSARPAGVVSGFIPGADPKLIINGGEVSPADVAEVSVPKTQAV